MSNPFGSGPAYIASSEGVRTDMIVQSWDHDIQHETVYFERTPQIPDKDWRMEHGDHAHQWVSITGGKVDDTWVVTAAQSQRRNVPCDGSCGGVCDGEGYDISVWVCRNTGEDLKPGLRDDPRGASRTVVVSDTLTLHVTSASGVCPPEIRNSRIESDFVNGDEHGIVFMDLPEVMYAGEQTFENGGAPTETTYTGGPLPRDH